METVLNASDLVKNFDKFTAVDGIDFRVTKGETFGLLGPNGAGKSTTIKMIATVLTRTSGTLQVFGMDPNKQGRQIRSRLGVVPQDDVFDEELSALENLTVYGRYFGMTKAESQARATQTLEFMQLDSKADNRSRELSGGMQRRLTIARALLSSPEMVLLDEPTSGLDPQARHLLWERLYRLKEQGVTLLLTTHYMDEAEQLSDRLIIMDGGKIADHGTPSELLKRHVTSEVVELRFTQNQTEVEQAIETCQRAGFRTEELPDKVLLYADDGDAAIQAILNAGVRPTGTYVRRSSLEDVFLAVTGRSLIEA